MMSLVAVAHDDVPACCPEPGETDDEEEEEEELEDELEATDKPRISTGSSMGDLGGRIMRTPGPSPTVCRLERLPLLCAADADATAPATDDHTEALWLLAVGLERCPGADD